MKKTFFVFAASAAVLFTSCTGNSGEKKTQENQTVNDSVKEQKKLDSLFNAAGKGVSESKDTTKK